MATHIHVHFGMGRRTNPKSRMHDGLNEQYTALLAERDKIIKEMEKKEDTGVTVPQDLKTKLADVHKRMAVIVKQRSQSGVKDADRGSVQSRFASTGYTAVESRTIGPVVYGVDTGKTGTFTLMANEALKKSVMIYPDGSTSTMFYINRSGAFPINPDKAIRALRNS